MTQQRHNVPTNPNRASALRARTALARRGEGSGSHHLITPDETDPPWRATSPGEAERGDLRLLLDLLHRALARRLVRAPAKEGRAVTEAAAAEVVVADFDDELGVERLPFGAALRAPAARAAGRVAGEAGRLDELLEPLRERGLVLGADRRAEADVVEQAPVVVEPEQQRADERAVGAVTEAADDAVGRAHALDLDHALTVAGLVGQVEALGDHPVERRADAGEPLARGLDVVGLGRQDDAVVALEVLAREVFEPRAPRGQRLGGERLAGLVGEEVEHDQRRRALDGELANAAGGGVDALEQVVERQPAVEGDHDLAVEDEALRAQACERLDELGEVSRQRLPLLRHQLDARAVAEDEAAEAVPLRFVLPAGVIGNLGDGERVHRRVVGLERQSHSTGPPVRLRPPMSGEKRPASCARDRLYCAGWRARRYKIGEVRKCGGAEAQSSRDATRRASSSERRATRGVAAMGVAPDRASLCYDEPPLEDEPPLLPPPPPSLLPP